MKSERPGILERKLVAMAGDVTALGLGKVCVCVRLYVRKKIAIKMPA